MSDGSRCTDLRTLTAHTLAHTHTHTHSQLMKKVPKGDDNRAAAKAAKQKQEEKQRQAQQVSVARAVRATCHILDIFPRPYTLTQHPKP
jgi:hypothetical protein